MAIRLEGLPHVQVLEDRLDLRRQGLADPQRVRGGASDETDVQARREICERDRGRGTRGPRSGDQHIEVSQDSQLAFTAYHEATTPAG